MSPEDDPSPQEPPAEAEQTELDLAAKDAPPPNKLDVPRTERYNPERNLWMVRGTLALGLLLLVALLAIGSYALVALHRLTKADLDSLNPIFASLVTLTGTAIGFYFGGGGRGGSKG